MRRHLSPTTVDQLGLMAEPMVVEQTKHIAALTSAMGDYERIECYEIITIEIRG